MEKIYRVQMNSKGMPNFSTAVEVDRPNAMEIMAAYHEGVRKGIAEAYEAYGLQGWMTVIRDTFCSDCRGRRHDSCEYRESCYTMRVLDEVERSSR